RRLQRRARSTVRGAQLVGIFAKLLAGRCELGKIGLLRYLAPEPTRHVRDTEVFLQAVVEHRERRFEIRRGDQRERRSVQILADLVVFSSEAHELAQSDLELAVLLAQRDDLTFGDRYRMAAMRMRDEYLGDDVRELLEEVRVFLQVMRAGVCVHPLPSPPVVSFYRRVGPLRRGHFPLAFEYRRCGPG